MPNLRAAAAALAVPLLAGCSLLDAVGLAPAPRDAEAVKRPTGERIEPERVVLRRVLIAFDKSGVRGVTRTKEEAQRLADRVLQMARSGQDFDRLVKLYSDERGVPSPIVIVNFGFPARSDEYERDKVDRGLARTAFGLEPGQIALQPHDPFDSPRGWSIVRRDR